MGTGIAVVCGSSLGDELLTYGDFSAATNWYTYHNTTITGGACVFNTADTWDTALSQGEGENPLLNLLNGHTYRVSFDITAYTSGGIRVRLLSNYSEVEDYTAEGSYTTDITVTSDGDGSIVFILTGAGAVLTLDNVSVKEVL